MGLKPRLSRYVDRMPLYMSNIYICRYTIEMELVNLEGNDDYCYDPPINGLVGNGVSRIEFNWIKFLIDSICRSWTQIYYLN